MSTPAPDTPPPVRAGTAAIVGRANVGKSTLLNAALELPLAIVSHKPQTTRVQLLGIVRHGLSDNPAEIGLLDTPGLHRANDRLGKEMNRSARYAARDADVVVYVVALPPKPPKPGAVLKPHRGDMEILKQLPEDKPTLLVINKIDGLKDKTQLLPLIQAYADAFDFAAVVPISARRTDGVQRVLDEIVPHLPQGCYQHAEDTLTDRPMRYFAAEYVREPILTEISQEVPHAVAVTVDEFIEPVKAGDVVKISATIHVERAGQKQIIIGRKGEMLKKIGTQARLRMEALLGQKCYLQLWVRVTPKWRQQLVQLTDFGLMSGLMGGRS